MALGILILGIAGTGVFCLFRILKQECKHRKEEQSIIKFLAEEIRNLRQDVDKLKK